MVLMIILRVIHILFAIFWMGSTIFLVSFVQPAVAATGPEGQKFMQQLGLRTRMSVALGISGLLVALSGLAMIWRLSGFETAWLSSGYGETLVAGGIFGIAALAVGYTYQGRSSSRMKVLMDQAQAAGGPPGPEVMGEIQAQAHRVQTGARLTAVLLTLAAVAMAIAQYVG
jgi:uncharacterized membrane protein